MSYHETNPTHHDDDWAEGQVLGFDTGDERGELSTLVDEVFHDLETLSNAVTDNIHTPIIPLFRLAEVVEFPKQA